MNHEHDTPLPTADAFSSNLSLTADPGVPGLPPPLVELPGASWLVTSSSHTP